MQAELIEIKYSLHTVEVMHREFYNLKRETHFYMGNLRKLMPGLVSFIALCNAQIIANPMHEKCLFQFTPDEAKILSSNIIYMVDAPPTLTALREKLLIRLADFASPQIKLP